MFSSRDAYDSERCPVRDELLGEMYRANEHGLARLVESVSSDVRAQLALFCYRKSHLHSLALSIASSCNERDLILLGGRVGGVGRGAGARGQGQGQHGQQDCPAQRSVRGWHACRAP